MCLLMCKNGKDCAERLGNPDYSIYYETKVSEENAFIEIEKQVKEDLIKKGIISILNTDLKKGSVNECYLINGSSNVLMHLKDDKYILIYVSSIHILKDHRYSSPEYLYNSLPREIMKAKKDEAVHHRMEKFDNRIGALQKCKKDEHPNHGSHNVKVIIKNISDFSSFVKYINYTNKKCYRCPVTKSDSKQKYIKKLSM